VFVETNLFKQMIAYKPLKGTENRSGQWNVKKSLMSPIVNFFAEKWWRMKKGRAVIDYIAWQASEKGFTFSSYEYIGEKVGCSPKTVRDVIGELQRAGEVVILNRRSSKHNGRGKPVFLFTRHEYYHYWADLLGLETPKADVKADCKAESSGIPWESKDEEPKKPSTMYLPKNIKKIDDIELHLIDFIASENKELIKDVFGYTVDQFNQRKDSIQAPKEYIIQAYLRNLEKHNSGTPFKIGQSKKKRFFYKNPKEATIPKWMKYEQKPEHTDADPQTTKKRERWLENFLNNL
jgi:hypothetical protein